MTEHASADRCTHCDGNLTVGPAEVRTGKVVWTTALVLCAGSSFAFAVGMAGEGAQSTRVAGAVVTAVLGLAFFAGLMGSWERKTLTCAACDQRTVQHLRFHDGAE